MNIQKHQRRVREMGCCVCRTTEGMTFHHCHGGSMIDYFGYAQNPGMSQRQNHFLGIPLCHKHHLGSLGVDSAIGLKAWEFLFETQVYWLLWVDEKLEYSIFDEAGVPAPIIDPIMEAASCL